MRKGVYPATNFFYTHMHWLTFNDGPTFLARWYPHHRSWYTDIGEGPRTYSPESLYERAITWAKPLGWNAPEQAQIGGVSAAVAEKAQSEAVSAPSDVKAKTADDVEVVTMALVLCAVWHESTTTKAEARFAEDDALRQRWIRVAKSALYRIGHAKDEQIAKLKGELQGHKDAMSSVTKADEKSIKALQDYAAALEREVISMLHEIFGVDGIDG